MIYISQPTKTEISSENDLKPFWVIVKCHLSTYFSRWLGSRAGILCLMWLIEGVVFGGLSVYLSVCVRLVFLSIFGSSSEWDVSVCVWLCVCVCVWVCPCRGCLSFFDTIDVCVCECCSRVYPTHPNVKHDIFIYNGIWYLPAFNASYGKYNEKGSNYFNQSLEISGNPWIWNVEKSLWQTRNLVR